jgi:hypothetical protein
MKGKVLCLICSEIITVLKEYNIVGHYNTSVRAVEMVNSLAENFKTRLMAFVAMSQMYISLKPILR